MYFTLQNISQIPQLLYS